MSSESPDPQGLASAATPAAPGRQPWWIPRFLGRVPAEVEERQIALLGAIALALIFEYYDVSMLGNAAKQIRLSFDLPQSDLGRLMGLVRLGAIPAFFLIPFADRLGRRRLFLACLVGTSLATLLTAFAGSADQFIVAQMTARIFVSAGSATAFVIVAEEFPAEHRGWALGMLGALGSFDFGLGALVFAAIDLLPGGWRALFLFGALPLLLLPWFRREVRETGRFQRHREQVGEGGADGWLRPLATLSMRYPGRALAVAAIGFMAAAGYGTAHGLLGDYVQTDHAWEPWQYSLMFFLGGGVGILGNTVAGRMADRVGRRAVSFAMLGIFPLIALIFYRGSGWILPVAWVPLVFVTTGGEIMVRALATELFPTSSRATAGGVLTLFETLGAIFGLFLVSTFTPEGHSNAPATSLVVFLTMLGALLALTLPETARRELEEISGGDAE